MAHVNAYARGRAAGRVQLAPSLNPYPEHTWDASEWDRGWIREVGLQLVETPEPKPDSALLLPHGAMSAAQLERLCEREGLALAHLGRARYHLVQTSTPAQSMLRIALTPDYRRDRRRGPRGHEPEAA